MINIVKPYKDDMIIPMTVSQFDDGIRIDVYEEYIDIAEEYEQSFKDDYFSDAALLFLTERIRPKGYMRYDDLYSYYLVYKMDDISELCDSDIPVQDIYDAQYVKDKTEFEADVIKENGQPASVIVKNGAIASIAAANYFIEDDEDEVELAVETLPEYRGRGYGKAVLCDMVKKVFKMGKYPTYRVSCFNEASIRTVEACGFKPIGKEYYINFYKEEE
ncbi:MAG: GNAT family N-acetyltransferase [Ruminococcaceae bacterium]|nr:GNAT family N-acetyltransferase [Oscillospiraceae bacterium]